jgi:serine/tyrosine/threonine adenylyltransferase
MPRGPAHDSSVRSKQPTGKPQGEVTRQGCRPADDRPDVPDFTTEDNPRVNAPERIRPPIAWREGSFWASLGQPGPALIENTTTPFGTFVPTRALLEPRWAGRSASLAREMGLEAWLGSDDALQVFSGARVDGQPNPFASVYSGHQFGVWAGQLGDGRAHTLGEIDTPLGAMELQLKGAGLTPYSRMADGRAVLRSSVREFLASEAMHALGIPTTRALALVASPLPVRRETLETAAIVTRVAPSFLRFGHFEHFTHTARDVQALRALADAAIARHFPTIDPAGPARHLELLHEVTERTATLMAQWQAVGFCHGVMNTDNMSLLGLTIDYGPYGFLDAYDPMHICNHSDHQGRYAYARQPGIAMWNLHALAHGLMPLIESMDAAKNVLSTFEPAFGQAMLQRLRAKLGLGDPADDDEALHVSDVSLIEDWLDLLAKGRVDFTIAHRRLIADAPGAPGAPGPGHEALRDLFLDRAGFDAWHARLVQRVDASTASLQAPWGSPARARALARVNPKFILRNHLAQAAIERAQLGDFDEVSNLLAVLEHPFDEQPDREAYAGFPPEWASSLEVSCSS